MQTLLQNNDAPPAGAGKLSTPVTRLYVVTPIAYTIAAVLAVALVFNVWLLYYTYTHHTGLSEEPFTLKMNNILCHNGVGAASVEGENGEA